MFGPNEDSSINILSDGEIVGSHGISLYSKQLQKNVSSGKKNLRINSEAVEKLKSRKLMREGPMIRSTRLEKQDGMFNVLNLTVIIQ